jgi:hypothetical protein
MPAVLTTCSAAVSFRAIRAASLRNFGVRFVSANECEAVEQKVAEKHLDKVVKYSPPSTGEDRLRDHQDAQGFLRSEPLRRFLCCVTRASLILLIFVTGTAVSQDPTPWFTRYRQEFVETLRFSDAELLDHPVACTPCCQQLVEPPMISC